MKYLTIIIVMLLAGLNHVIAAEAQNQPKPAANSAVAENVEEVDAELEQPALPEKNTTEYWVVRSQAMTEFIPFLTKKRSEVKKIRKLLADYLLEIGKANDFADRKMPVVFDGKVYAEILQIGESFSEMNVEIPKVRPSWDELVEIAMQYIVYEGFLPTDVEEGEEATMYIHLCKKKEEYGQKVRQDARSILDQSAKMWVYLGQIEKLDDFKAYAADLILEQKAAKAKEKAMYTEMHRQEVIQRAADKKQREFDDAEDRASYRSSRRSRAYSSRQAQQQYRQSRLDERYTNSRAYYY